MNYTPPYKITSKIVNLISKITEEMTKIEINKANLITPKLIKINCIKIITGYFLGEERIKKENQ